MTFSDGMRGAFAGALGGVVGGAIKLACEAVVPPRSPDRKPPPGVLVADIVRRTDGRELSDDEIERAASSVHWVFSVLTGALYGAVVEWKPGVEKAEGIPLGLALWIGLHEIALPILHATPPVANIPASEHVNECVTHGAYGFGVERTRRALRPLLDPV